MFPNRNSHWIRVGRWRGVSRWMFLYLSFTWNARWFILSLPPCLPVNTCREQAARLYRNGEEESPGRTEGGGCLLFWGGVLGPTSTIRGHTRWWWKQREHWTESQTAWFPADAAIYLWVVSGTSFNHSALDSSSISNAYCNYLIGWFCLKR